MKQYLWLFLCLSGSISTCLAQHRGVQRIWSDTPAYTQVMENENERGLTSDLWDGVWQGDPVPSLPRIVHPSLSVKTWEQGEETNYLNEETNALTRGKYPNPIRLWEQESYFLGNGRIAVSAFHGSGRDRYVLNEVSFWSGGRNGGTINSKGDKGYAGQNGPEVTDQGFGGSQPAGDLIIDFGAPVERGSFLRELCLDQALARSVAKRGGKTIRSIAFCSYPDQVFVTHYTSDQPHSLQCRILFATQRKEDAVSLSGHRILLVDRLANGMECRVVAEVRPYGGSLESRAGCLQLTGADSCTVVVTMETNYLMDFKKKFRGESAEKRIERRLQEVGRWTYADLLAHHLKDYHRLYDRQQLVLDESNPYLDQLSTAERLSAYKNGQPDPGLENIVFNYGRYLMIASSRPGSLPASLQGIWNARTHAPWGNDYHSNINFQMVYWLPEVGNLSECHLPMLNYLDAMREPDRIATQEYLSAIGKPAKKGENGWIVYTSQNPFGGNGWQVNLPGSAWYSLHFWEHFAFTRDTTYLRKTAYPVLKELSEYWEQHLKVLGKGGQGFESEYKPVDITKYPELASVKEGTLVVPNGWSPEIGPRGEDGVSHDQEIVSTLFANTIAAADILHQDKAWISNLKSKLAKMAQPKIGKMGNLMEWMIDRNPVTDHRHTSHLFSVYPGNMISMETTPQLAEAARKSLQFRKTTGNSRRAFAWAWRSCLWARLRDGDKAHAMVEGLMDYNMLDNLLTTQNLPLQMDANYGIAAAMLEMIIQSQAGVIELLPAPTTHWVSGKIRGAKARGNIQVDLSWKDGKVIDWRVYSPDTFSHPVKVRVNGEYHEVMPEKIKDPS